MKNVRVQFYQGSQQLAFWSKFLEKLLAINIISSLNHERAPAQVLEKTKTCPHKL
jgi:hypothetical protein